MIIALHYLKKIIFRLLTSIQLPFNLFVKFLTLAQTSTGSVFRNVLFLPGLRGGVFPLTRKGFILSYEVFYLQTSSKIQ